MHLQSLLQNLYDEATLVHSPIPIHHFDLYRLPSGSPPTLERLNLQVCVCVRLHVYVCVCVIVVGHPGRRDNCVSMA
jgi:tRNA A37 threonylcarbamoyladenosine biosynthesis protein TsaE